jgi:predicted ATP-dependent endonuclease of OLD family
MKIEKIKIHNWRSIADEEITFESLMIFIGQNNCGKSNIISSLLFFFGTITANSLDYHNNSNEAFVEVTFGNLDDFDANQFRKYLSSDNKICVRKTLNSDGETTYNGFLFSPKADFLKEEAISIISKREELEKTPLKDLVPTTGRLTKDIIKAAQEEYINKNKDIIELDYTLETSSFLGVKNVAKGIFGDIYFIPAVKNASDEFKTSGTTIFNQLFTQIISRMSEENEHYKNARLQMQSLTQILNKLNDKGEVNKERPTEIKTLEDNLEFELKKWNTTIDIEITPPNIDEVLKVNTSVWVDDGKRTDIARKGHGLQRSLIFALIKSWASHLKKEKELKEKLEESESKTPTTKRKSSQSTYFFFEEPELYLHPQAQKELYASLKELSVSDYQVILCTHSSSFLDLADYKSICIVNKTNVTIGSKVRQFTNELFGADEKANFNLVYWLNPERSELFFANKVILSEGPTDKTIIPKLAKLIGSFKYDYTIIECGGKDSIKLYVKLLNKFKIPYVVVYDKDHQADKDANGRASADTSSKAIEDIIDATIGKSVIFVNDIEEELGLTDKKDKNKPFIALTAISDPAFTITDSLQAKIKEAYN